MKQLRIVNALFAVVSILLAGFAIFLAIKWDNAKSVARQQRVVIDSLYTNYEIVHTNAAQSAGLLRALSDSNIVIYNLEGMPIAPEDEAVVYWNKVNGQVYLNPYQLSPTAKNSFYQLWAYNEDTPFNLGLVDMEKSPYQIQRMRDVKTVDEFLINKVQGGEKSRPLLEKVVVASQ